MKGNRGTRKFTVIFYVLGILFIGVPLLSLFINPFTGTSSIVDNSFAIDAILVSLRTTAITVLVVILLGTPLAYASARLQFRGKEYLDLILNLPLVLPPAVAGLLLLMTFGKNGLIGSYLYNLGIQLPFSQGAVILAQLFVALPLYIKTGAEGFKRVQPKLEMTAMTLGDTPIASFLRVTLPLTKDALLTGAIMAWARALAEFGATIMFAGNLRGKTQTLPLAIYTAMESDMSVALGIARIMFGVSILVLIIVSILSKRRGQHAQM